jgi:hypothetical protein
MVKWVLEDDCLVPGRQIKIEYKGKNPFLAYQAAIGIFTDVFQVDSTDCYERDFKWDTTSDPRGFYARFIVEKKLDAKSRIFFEIIMQGKQPSSPEKEGEVVILMSGKLNTSYDLDTPFQQSAFYRSLLWLYNFFFYFRVRRNYIKFCEEGLFKLRDAYMSLLKLK